MFRMASLALVKDEFSADEVYDCIQKRVECTDAQLSNYPQPDQLLPKLALLHTVMTKVLVKVPRVTFQFSNGSCRGVLTSAYFWEGVLDGSDCH